MEKNQRAIGIFDSGMGGLSVLAELIKLLPSEHYIYYADCKNSPYGNLSAEKIICHVMKGVNALTDYNVKMLVIACNTATAAAIGHIRAAVNVPVIGLEPAILPAIKQTKTKNILMLATDATIKCKNYCPSYNGINLMCCACKELASLIENNFYNDNLIYNYIIKLIKGYKNFDYDCVVLGCTHYILKKHLFANAVKSKAIIIDGNGGTAQNTARILKKKNISAECGGGVDIILSQKDTDRENLYKFILKNSNF